MKKTFPLLIFSLVFAWSCTTETSKPDPNLRFRAEVNYLELFYLDGDNKDLLKPGYASFNYPILTESKTPYLKPDDIIESQGYVYYSCEAGRMRIGYDDTEGLYKLEISSIYYKGDDQTETGVFINHPNHEYDELKAEITKSAHTKSPPPPMRLVTRLYYNGTGIDIPNRYEILQGDTELPAAVKVFIIKDSGKTTVSFERPQ